MNGTSSLRRLSGNWRVWISQSPVLAEALEELHVTVEELAATGTALQQQQEELVEAHARAEAERARYHDLFTFAPDGYLVTGIRGGILEANRAAGELFNIDAGLLGGRLLISFVLKEDQSRFLEWQEQLASGVALRNVSVRLRRKGGPTFHAAIVARPVSNDQSMQVITIRWMLRDVSDQVAQEAALHESEAALAAANANLEQRIAERTAELAASEARFRLVLQASPVTVFHQDRELRYTWIHNPIPPFRPEEIIGKSEFELLEAENAERLSRLKRQVIESGQGTRLEVPRVLPQETRWYDMTLEPQRSADGQISGLTGVVTDITEYRRAADHRAFLDEIGKLLITSLDPESLLQNLARYVSLNFADGCLVCLMDEAGEPALRIARHRAPSRSGELHEQIAHSLQAASGAHPLQQAARNLEEVLTPLAEPDARLLALPLLARNQCIGVIGLLRETGERQFSAAERQVASELARRVGLALDTTHSFETALQARAQAEAALKARNQMINLVSHDLKSPLTAARGYVDLMRRRLTKLEAAQSGKMLEHCDKLAGIIGQIYDQVEELLNIARLEAGQSLQLERKAIDLPALLQRLCENHRQISDQHQIILQAAGNELTISGDERRLERVFSNLLTNAIKYSPNGGKITVIIEPEERNSAPGANISISDEGIGIPAEELPDMFEHFRRGSNVQSRIGGSGLGLVSARYIVEQHGGSIEVASSEGQGSSFSIWLPLAGEPA